jgi:deazaflavin-dependent oxidoreductase (nitroreductase family)
MFRTASGESVRLTAEGIPRVDPLVPANAATRLIRRSFDIRPVGQSLIRVAARLDPFVHAWTRGRFGQLVPMPFVSMTTTGAKSRESRTSAVIYFNDGDDVILIASNYGGTRHPAWYHNLKADPTAELRRANRSGTYVATEVTDEAEHERLFDLGNRVYPGYAQYRVRTAATGRRIPIMRLHRTGSVPSR